MHALRVFISRLHAAVCACGACLRVIAITTPSRSCTTWTCLLLLLLRTAHTVRCDAAASGTSTSGFSLAGLHLDSRMKYSSLCGHMHPGVLSGLLWLCPWLWLCVAIASLPTGARAASSSLLHCRLLLACRIGLAAGSRRLLRA